MRGKLPHRFRSSDADASSGSGRLAIDYVAASAPEVVEHGSRDERSGNSQFKGRFCKQICKPDATERVETGRRGRTDGNTRSLYAEVSMATGDGPRRTSYGS